MKKEARTHRRAGGLGDLGRQLWLQSPETVEGAQLILLQVTPLSSDVDVQSAMILHEEDSLTMG